MVSASVAVVCQEMIALEFRVRTVSIPIAEASLLEQVGYLFSGASSGYSEGSMRWALATTVPLPLSSRGEGVMPVA